VPPPSSELKTRPPPTVVEVTQNRFRFDALTKMQLTHAADGAQGMVSSVAGDHPGPRLVHLPGSRSPQRLYDRLSRYALLVRKLGSRRAP
jgi:hypothetical protein